MTRARRLVYVSGAPGAGKSSLAGPLAAALGYALITKDTIKETLHDALGAPEADLAWSRQLGAASMEPRPVDVAAVAGQVLGHHAGD